MYDTAERAGAARLRAAREAAGIGALRVDPAKLTAAREAAGLSLRAAGEKIGRAHTTVMGYEKGIAPPADVLLQLAAVYAVPVESLCSPARAAAS